MRKILIAVLAIICAFPALAPVTGKAAAVVVEIGDRGYYRGPSYWGPRRVRYYWIPGHWVWRRHARFWIHGHYIAR